MNKPLQLKHLHIENIRCFDTVDLSFFDEKPRTKTVVTGPNGHGKTSILRAIAIGITPTKEANALIEKLAGDMIRISKKGNAKDRAQIRLDLYDPAKPNVAYSITTHIVRDASGQEIVTKETVPDPFPWSRLFVCGYGVNRGSERYAPVEDYSLSASLQSLFSEEPSLYDPVAVLKNFKLASSEATAANMKVSKLFGSIQPFFQKVLALPSLKLDVSSKGVEVHGPWGNMPFHALGDGYRGTATWTLDCLGRAYQKGVDFSDRGPAGGILLVDEVDEHLHPSWQRKILDSLAKKLPHMQIVGTTHNPMTIANCGPGEVAECSLKNAIATLNYPLPPPGGHTADQILKGVWFGLDETMDTATEKLLAEYRKAVHEQEPQKLEQARTKVRDYLGFSPLTLMDEYAMAIANTYRDEYHNAAPKERARLLSEGLERLKQKLGTPS